MLLRDQWSLRDARLQLLPVYKDVSVNFRINIQKFYSESIAQGCDQFSVVWCVTNASRVEILHNIEIGSLGCCVTRTNRSSLLFTVTFVIQLFKIFIKSLKNLQFNIIGYIKEVNIALFFNFYPNLHNSESSFNFVNMEVRINQMITIEMILRKWRSNEFLLVLLKSMTVLYYP